MKGNFCVTKGVAGFTSVAPNQGIEQENRTLKAIGGIVRITQNEKALDKVFLIALELSKLLHEFYWILVLQNGAGCWTLFALRVDL